ncbi:MAG: PAS domain S-box protein [Balneolales bacterium]|nr:PAS domain S-box protein [Balneolales bacterium]
MTQEFYSTIEIDLLTQQVLNTIPEEVALLNNRGEVVAHNLNWQRSKDRTGANWVFPGLGKNILRELQIPLSTQNADALRLIISIKSILNKEQSSSIANVKIHTGENEKWLQAMVSSLITDELYILKYRDISKEVSKSSLNKSQYSSLKQLLDSEYRGEITTDLSHSILTLDGNAREILQVSNREPGEYVLSTFIPSLKNRTLEEVYVSKSEIFTLDGEKINAKILAAKFFEPEYGQFIIRCTFEGLDQREFTNYRIKRHLKYFHQLFKSTPNGISIIDKKGQILDVNASFEQMFGYNKSELIDKDYIQTTVSEEFQSTEQAHLSKVFKGSEVHVQTFRRKKNGVNIPVLMSLMPLEIKGKIKEAFCLFVDLSDQVRSQAIIEQQLKEKEVLIQEIHHRVKNNLAVISGLISLEGYYTGNPEVREHLETTESRIHSIAKIHELLYKHDNFSSINFVEYLHELSTAFSDEKSKQLTISSLDKIIIDVNQAIPFGMLLNEILSITYHRFHGINGDKLTLDYKITEDERYYSVTIEDLTNSGVLNFIEGKSQDLATELVMVLLHQLDADYRLVSHQRSFLSIRFPKVQYSRMNGVQKNGFT